MDRISCRVHDGIMVAGCKTVFGQFERKSARLTSAIVRLAIWEDILHDSEGRLIVSPDRLRELIEAEKQR